MPEAHRPGGPIGPSQFGVERFTIPDVLDLRAEQIGDRTMMTIAGTPVTFAQMRDRSCAAANVLAHNGVSRGDTVALFTATCPEWVYFWLGAARIGAVTAAVNVANKDEFLLHALRLSRAKVVITDAERHPRLNEIVDRVETASTALVVGDSLTDALVRASNAPPDADPVGPDELAALFFTSGTTGPSKAVATTWHYLFSAAAGVAAAWELEAGDVVWSAMPLFHLSAAPSVLAPMLLGVTTVLSAAFRPSEVWDEVRSCGAAGFAGAGAMVSMLWNQPPDRTRLAVAAAIHLCRADPGRYVPRHRAALRRKDRDDVRHDRGVPDRVQERLRRRRPWNLGTGECRVRRPHRRQERTITALRHRRRDRLQAEVGHT